MNFIDFFYRSAQLYPDRPAMHFCGESWSYRDLAQLANRVANGLKQLGVQPGTKCAVVSRNDPFAFIAMLGIMKARAVWVPLNPANAQTDNTHILKAFDVEIVFHQRASEGFVAHAMHECPALRTAFCLGGGGEVGQPFEDWMLRQRADDFLLPWEPDRLCWLRGTGGTTGLPKGVMNTNRNFETMVANFMATLRFDDSPVYLACAPLSHAAAVLSMVTLAMGGQVVIQRKFDPAETLAAIEQHRISFIYLPPTAIYMLLDRDDVRDYDYSSLRHFIYGAAPTSAAKLKEAIEVFGPVMTQAYGQTEVPTSVAYMSPKDHLNPDGTVNERRLLSCGRPAPFTRMAIMDDDGQILPPGAIGEIVVQGGLVMQGYYKNPEATADASRFGWHHTGDLAYQDEDGFIYVCDRKKEMIISGGYNVYPLEVEQALLQHPSVRDCAVIGVPDSKWGEAIKAVVELKSSATVAESDLIAHCKAVLGSIKAPKSIDFTDDLPRSPAGKVMRKEVRKQYWEGQARLV